MPTFPWACNVTGEDKIRYIYERGSLKVNPISEKVEESRLRWNGHVSRRSPNHAVNKALNISEPARKRALLMTTWLRTVENDLRRNNLEARMTEDR